MIDLLPRIKGKPGRPRTVSAHAWIDRKNARAPWKSNVYVGNGRVHVLSTSTMDRAKALDFNRAHLLHSLQSKIAQSHPTESQIHLELGVA